MKTCDEWSRNFDRLYNNITSNQAPGLTEYEKSEFLTDAQDNVLIMLYNGTLGKSFEETEEITAYLSSLVCQSNCCEVSGDYPHVISSSVVYELPDDILFRTLELCTINTEDCQGLQANVVPITQDEYWRTTRNPFKKQNSRRVLRLSSGDADSYSSGLVSIGYSELISDYPIASYSVRYIKKPEPIILVDLEDGLTIRGESSSKTCKLHEFLHQAILTEAVRMAKAVWTT